MNYNTQYTQHNAVLNRNWLTLKEAAKVCGVPYMHLYRDYVNGKVDGYIHVNYNKSHRFGPTGTKYYVFESDIPSLKARLKTVQPSPVVSVTKKLTPHQARFTPEIRKKLSDNMKAHHAAKRAAKEAAKQTQIVLTAADTPKADSTAIALHLIKNGFDDAGLFLIKNPIQQ